MHGGWGGFGCGSDEKGCEFWGEGGCASSCFSSFWETATPTPTAFCNTDSGLGPCITAACGDDSGFSSYSSRRSSLCSEFSSCDSTGTYTYTYKTPGEDGWGPWGGGRGGDGSGPWGTRTWPTGEVVYTGCPWNGDGWGFPFWGGYGYGSDFWDSARPGWAHTTVTTTVSGDSTSAVVTLEQAVSGDATTLRTLGSEQAQETSDTSGAAPAPGGGGAGGSGLMGVKVMGAALGAVVVAVGML